MNIIEAITNTSEATSRIIMAVALTTVVWLFVITFLLKYVRNALVTANKVIDDQRHLVEFYRTRGLASKDSMGKRVALIYAAETAITPMHWGITETKRDSEFVRPGNPDSHMFFRFETVENINSSDALTLALPMDGETFLNAIELTQDQGKAKVGRD